MTESQRMRLAAEIAEILIQRVPALKAIDELGGTAGRVVKGEHGLAFELPEVVSLEELERAYVVHVLETAAWNKTTAADLLGIDPSTLYRKLDRWGIEQR